MSSRPKEIKSENMTKENLAFWQVVMFVETLNYFLVRSLQKEEPTQRIQKNITELFKASVLMVRSKILSSRSEDLGSSMLWKLATQAGVAAPPDEAVINNLTQYLLRPTFVKKVKGGDLATEGPPPYLSRIQEPRALGARILIGGQKPMDRVDTKINKSFISASVYWDEKLDTFLIARSFLKDYIRTSTSEETAFFVQQSIRKALKISHTAENRYPIYDICARANSIFFGMEKPAIKDLHTKRSSTIDITFFIHEIQESIKASSSPKHLDRSELSRKAFCYLMFLRFCRLLRVRYYWDPDSEEEIYYCLSAARAIRPSYVIARMFGSISDISGLNYIFKGAILPRLDTGRTIVISGQPGAGKTVLALQKLLSIATRGGLSIFFSLEEAHELIISRMAAFGLTNNEKFEILDLQQERVKRGTFVKRSFFKRGYFSPSSVSDTIHHILTQQPEDFPKKRGVFLLYSLTSDTHISIIDAIRELGEITSSLRKWCAVGIDSLNALVMPKRGQDNGIYEQGYSREIFQELFQTIEESKILGVCIAESHQANNLEAIPFLADTFIKLNSSMNGRLRTLEVQKCRSQDYHAGEHPFRLTEGVGLRVYPSVSAVRASLRLRNRTTLSEQRYILFPDPLTFDHQSSHRESIAEKSTTLIYGEPNCRKTRIALELALSTPVSRIEEALPPASILAITFRTTERNFAQEIRAKESLSLKWSSLRHRAVRWYSPGDNISAAQILAGIRKEIKDARDNGTPLDRVIIDEIESAELCLPALRDRPLFWSTIIQLLSTEAITAFFIYGEGWKNSNIVKILKLECDYVLSVRKNRERHHTTKVWPLSASIEKYPDVPLIK